MAATDLDGLQRVVDGIDIGCYERDGAPPDPDPDPDPPPPTGPQSLWGALTAPGFFDNHPWCFGTIFSVAVPGKLTGVRLYAVQGERGSHTLRLWNNATGKQVGVTRTFSASGTGWRTYDLPAAIALTPGVAYTVAITTGSDGRRRYAAILNALQSGGTVGSLSYPAHAGVFGTVLNQRPTQVYKSINYLRDVVFVAD